MPLPSEVPYPDAIPFEPVRENKSNEACDWQGDLAEPELDDLAHACAENQDDEARHLHLDLNQECDWRGDPVETIVDEFADQCAPAQPADNIKCSAAQDPEPSVAIDEKDLLKVPVTVKKPGKAKSNAAIPGSGTLAPKSPQFAQPTLPEVLPQPVSNGDTVSNLPVPRPPAESWRPPVIPKANNEKTRLKEEKAKENEQKLREMARLKLEKKQKKAEKKWKHAMECAERTAQRKIAKAEKEKKKRKAKATRLMEQEKSEAAKDHDKKNQALDVLASLPPGAESSAAAAAATVVQPDSTSAPSEPPTARETAIDAVKKRIADGMGTVKSLDEDQPTSKDVKAEVKARQDALDKIKKKLQEGWRSVNDLPAATDVAADPAAIKAQNDAIEDIKKKLQEGWESLLSMNTQAAEEAKARNDIIEDAKKKLEDGWENLLATEEADTTEAQARNDIVHDIIEKIRGGFRGLPAMGDITNAIGNLLPGLGEAQADAASASPAGLSEKPKQKAKRLSKDVDEILCRRHQMLKEIERAGTTIHHLNEYLDERSKHFNEEYTNASKQAHTKHKVKKEVKKEIQQGHVSKKNDQVDGSSDMPSLSNYPSKPSTALRSPGSINRPANPLMDQDSPKTGQTSASSQLSQSKRQSPVPTNAQSSEPHNSPGGRATPTNRRRSGMFRLSSDHLSAIRYGGAEPLPTPASPGLRKHQNEDQTFRFSEGLKRAHGLSVDMSPQGLSLADYDSPTEESRPESAASRTEKKEHKLS